MRLREHLPLRHAEVLAVVGVGALLPHLRDLFDRLPPHGLRLRDVLDAEAVHLGGGGPAAGAELEAVVGQVVEEGHVLGDAHRLVHRRGDVEDGRTEVHAGGDGRAVAEERLRPGHVGVLVEEVVLRAPHVLEGVAVGGHGDVDVAHDPLVLGVRVDRTLELGDEQLGEDAELHGGCLLRQAGANDHEPTTN